MAWVILVLVLLAAAFGVLGAVIKAAAFLVLTILLAVAALVAIATPAGPSLPRRPLLGPEAILITGATGVAPAGAR